jgi:hypothetical protein
MLLFLFLCLITAGFVIELVQKHVLKMKEPDIRELWTELEEQEWYRTLLSDPELHRWVELDKQNGLLKDPYYVRKIIDQSGHRDGYICYIRDKTK